MEKANPRSKYNNPKSFQKYSYTKPKEGETSMIPIIKLQKEK